MAELPNLPYDYDALEPHIDEATMKLHHGKHHAAYTNNYNNAVAGTEFENMDVDEVLAQLDSLPAEIRGAVRNNGGGFSNHAKFWEWMTPGGSEPSAELATAIDSAFGSMDAFKEAFAKAGMTQFGSGWAWLVLNNGNLEVMSTPNQDTPISQGMTPLLGCDVWEHAYYKLYGPGRADYLAAWWNVVNWSKVSEDFANAN